ncbi:MAG: MaoC family dehydratase [Dehalococcoidia bacterium]|jgi:acyl dehydratase|nr:MaoC family dehydratase [Dehalococcoidia bacterium]MDP6227787.1 MaoC family dehydratase [Dehalococcoidia bacterium]MDP7085362.1 MaoC family dehydratase [Dehalococcoidia bacterium]MDP7202154.1 MaoC family dehydratase [Dehalococcoidia bacterium]HJN88405.1 MaoC family dehydratase [Dehalococcoidia bacterium]|tara:strand:+ start:137 stop:580 length:444 start_codon:yes stop_codon:yes gene_type:complete
MTTGVANIADIEVGFELPSLSWPMSLGHMRLFSGWPGLNKYGHDEVNQHTSVEVAKRLGRPAPIVAGPQMFACLEEMLVNFFGMDWFTGGKLDTHYVGVLLAGDTITTGAKVIEKVQEGDKTRLEMEVWGENQRQAKVVVGFASITK